MQEELDEIAEAMERGDLVAMADGFGDLLYVTYGSAAACGIPIEAVFAEIHRSNMTKTIEPITYGKNGKIMKGVNYQPPRLERIVFPEMPHMH